MITPDKTLGIRSPLDHSDIQRIKLCIDAVIKNLSFGTLIISKGGIGKTHNIREMLLDAGLIEGTDWIHIAANITDTELYKTLYDNNDKIIFFDDIGAASRTIAGTTILKQATETKNGKDRIISWVSPTYILKEYPTSFAFYGRLIMCLNISPNEKDGNIEALTSRFMCCIIEPSNKTILEMIYSLKFDLSDIINPEEFDIIYDYISYISNENTKINIRIFKNAIVWFKQDKNWKTYVNEDIGLDNDTQTVISIISSGFKGIAATNQWMKITGKKKSAFYNIFDRLKREHIL